MGGSCPIEEWRRSRLYQWTQRATCHSTYAWFFQVGPPSLNLLCMSSRGCRCGSSVEMAVDLAGEVALERASDLATGARRGGAAFDVGECVGGDADPGGYGHVEGAVEASVATSLDSVAHGVPGRRGDWVHAGQAGERSFAPDASG